MGYSFKVLYRMQQKNIRYYMFTRGNSRSLRVSTAPWLGLWSHRPPLPFNTITRLSMNKNVDHKVCPINVNG